MRSPFVRDLAAGHPLSPDSIHYFAPPPPGSFDPAPLSAQVAGPALPFTTPRGPFSLPVSTPGSQPVRNENKSADQHHWGRSSEGIGKAPPWVLDRSYSGRPLTPLILSLRPGIVSSSHVSAHDGALSRLLWISRLRPVEGSDAAWDSVLQAVTGATGWSRREALLGMGDKDTVTCRSGDSIVRLKEALLGA